MVSNLVDYSGAKEIMVRRKPFSNAIRLRKERLDGPLAMTAGKEVVEFQVEWISAKRWRDK